MSPVTALISFGAELVTMLVGASGLVLAARRSRMVERSAWSRFVLGTGFAILGVGAFLHGSLIIASNPSAGLAASRMAAAALILVGSQRWQLGIRARLVLLTGLVLVIAAALVEATDGPVATGAVVLAIGGISVGLPLVVAGRQSIATRVAVATAGTLLLVLVVVSVAMSQVISSSVTNQDLARLAQRGSSEGVETSITANDALRDARLAGAYLQSSILNPLINLATLSGIRDATDQALVVSRLNQLSQIYPGGGFAYVLPNDALALSSDAVASTVQALTHSDQIGTDGCSGGGSARLLVGGSAAWAVGTFAECVATGGAPAEYLGSLISVTPLDATYLLNRRQVDPTVSLSLVAAGKVIASSGVQPAAAVVTNVAGQVTQSKRSVTAVMGDRFVSAQPVAAATGTTSDLSIVASSSTASLVATRERLFRTLFLIALGSTLAALALAVLVGERITAGVRRLTEVAGRIQAGQASERAGTLGRDEVGVLGAAFDSMIDSVEDQAAALRAAADDETRLRNRLQAVVAGIGDSLIAVDVRGHIMEVNSAAEKLFGFMAPVVRGELIHNVISGEGEEGEALEAILGRPSSPGLMIRASVRAAGGVDVPVAVSVGVIRGPAGEAVGAVVVLRDLRSELELERMKTEFLSRVGHELRSPLTGIMGYSDILLRRDVDPAKARRWHEEILAGAKRLLRIVEMLEFFASAGAGRVRLRPEPLDMVTLISGVAAKWTERLGTAHPMSRRVDPATPRVMADRRWLVLALDELIDNAAKFSPTGGRISIVAGLAGTRGQRRDPLLGSRGGLAAAMVEISIIDHGEGMTEEQQMVAFGEFVQADASDTRRFGGLGLGLALVKRVVEGHGGTVTCRSVPGRGSTFTVHVPAGIAEDVAPDLASLPLVSPRALDEPVPIPPGSSTQS